MLHIEASFLLIKQYVWILRGVIAIVVYVIDDDPDCLRTLISIVESMRLKATACVDAAQFLTCYAEDQPACLVTDLRMRGMSGLDLLRYL